MKIFVIIFLILILKNLYLSQYLKLSTLSSTLYIGSELLDGPTFSPLISQADIKYWQFDNPCLHFYSSDSSTTLFTRPKSNTWCAWVPIFHSRLQNSSQFQAQTLQSECTQMSPIFLKIPESSPLISQADIKNWISKSNLSKP